MHTEPNDGDLLRRTLGGDEEAFATLYRRYQTGVYRFARQMTGSDSLAEEVTQEVFMTLMREGKSFDPRRGCLRSWLYGIGRNYISRCLERERPYVPLENESGEESKTDLLPDMCSRESALTGLTERETIEQVRRAVLSLPGGYREVVVLCELQEISYAEAAQILGCALGTVRSRLHRARALLAQRLKAAERTRPAAVSGARQCRR